MATLYIVATPIGNLEDITLRAVRVLKEVQTIVAEDTRQTRKLLIHYGIEKPLFSLHEHSQEAKVAGIIEKIKSGDVAYVVDAGTPGISDPGARLVQAVLSQEDIQVVPIPGTSSLTALLSIAGIPTDRFLFLGFLPKKKGRATLLRSIAESPYPVVFFESPYRIMKTLEALEKEGDFYCIVGRELTKKFETIYRGKTEEVIEQLKKDKVRGEFTVIVQTQNAKRKTKSVK